MYTRSYFPEEGGISIPQNYDGNALFDSPSEEPTSVGIPKTTAQETKISPRFEEARDIPDENYSSEIQEPAEEEAAPAFAGLFPFKLFPGGLKSIFNLDSFHIGTEEILIIAVALFLLFSKGGDKECSVILLLLLLIN